MSDGTMEHIAHLERILERCRTYVAPLADSADDTKALLNDIDEVLADRR